MARSYPSRRFPAGPYLEPTVSPALRGPKRTGPIGAIVPGDDIEVARELARLGRKPLKEPIVYAIKLTGDLETDQQVTEPVDGFFIWPVEWDVNLLTLVEVTLSCSTVSSSGDVEVMIRKIADVVDGEDPIDDEDLLDAEFPLVIEEGRKHSWKSEIQPEILLEHAQVVWGDELAVDFDAVGTDVRGFTIHFWFR